MRAFAGAICVVMLTGWWGAQGAPADGAPRSLTLEEAIRLGLSRNPSLAASRSRSEAAAAGARAAEAARWPRLSTEAGVRRSNHQVTVFGDKLTAGEFTADDFALDSLNDPDPVSHLTTAIALEAPLFTAGRMRWGIESARHEARAEQALLRLSESGLAARITEAYFGVALARASVAAADAALANARGHESVAASRFEAGAALRSDPLRARVFRLGRENDLDRRRADLAVAISRLSRLLGLDPGETPDPVTPLEAPADAIGSPDEWIARAMGRTPALEAGRETAASAGAGAEAARSESGPEVAGFARYERNAGGIDWGEGSYALGVGLRWSPFDRARAARISSAEARSAAAEAASRAVEDEVRLTVEQAFHDAATAERSVGVSREAVEAAEAAHRIAAERYAGGLLPLTELLDVETEMLNARLAAITALHDAVVGRVRLAHAAGTLEVRR